MATNEQLRHMRAQHKKDNDMANISWQITGRQQPLMQRRQGQATPDKSMAEQSDDEHEYLFDLFEEQPPGLETH